MEKVYNLGFPCLPLCRSLNAEYHVSTDSAHYFTGTGEKDLGTQLDSSMIDLYGDDPGPPKVHFLQQGRVLVREETAQTPGH